MRSARLLALAGTLVLAAACEPERLPPDAADRDGDGRAAWQDCDDADARVHTPAVRYRDADGDGVAAGPAVNVCVGVPYEPPGWSSTPGGDCDDGDASSFRSAGLFADGDGDGRGAGEPRARCIGEGVPAGWAVSGADCAPADPGRWGEVAYTHRDADGDARHVPEDGAVCAGQALPPGYAVRWVGEADCDDADPARFHLFGPVHADADGDGVGEGEARSVCGGDALPAGFAAAAGDCAPADASSWQLLTYFHVDGDQDGATVPSSGQVCTGATLPPGLAVEPSGDDCDDRDGARDSWRWLLPDPDEDGHGSGAGERLCTGAALPAGWAERGEDCAPADATRWRAWDYTVRDRDGDGRTVAEAGTLCLDDGPAPAGYGTIASGDDCDDGDASSWARVTGYVDADGDGVGVAPGLVACTAGALPPGQAAAAGDCAEDDPGRWRLLSHGFADRDGDGYTGVEAGQVCAGAALPDPFRAAASGNDCDDGTPDQWRWVVLYPDADADGVGAPPRQIPCLGASIPAGLSREGWDEEDGDPDVQEAEAGVPAGAG